MARDSFPPSVLTKLRGRVANRCSNPDHRVPTSAPGPGDDAVNNIGVAAHIHAASPGGPRYDEGMSPQQRRSISNALWLCASCATMIDRDTEKYTPDLLRAWKAQAEQAAAAELGRPLPGVRDAVDQLVTAMGGQPTRFMPQAISNVHSAATETLEALDPRFTVQTSFKDGVTNIGLHVKETVPFKLHVPAGAARQWQRGLTELLEHAVAAKVPLHGVSASGTPLMAKLLNGQTGPDATLSIVPHGRPAVAKITLPADGNRPALQLDDAHGEVFVGRKTVRFEGKLFGQIVSIVFVLNLDPEPMLGQVKLGIDLAAWDGQDVRRLPYFDRIRDLWSALASKAAVDFALEIEGQTLVRGGISFGAKHHEYFTAVNALLGYTRRARVVASGTGELVRFDHACNYTAQEHLKLEEAAAMFEGRYIFGRQELSGFVKATVLADADASNLHAFLSDPPSRAAMTIQPAPVAAFGHLVPLPQAMLTLRNVRTRVVGDTRHVVEGDEFKVQWEPVEGFQGRMDFIPADAKVDGVRLGDDQT